MARFKLTASVTIMRTLVYLSLSSLSAGTTKLAEAENADADDGLDAHVDMVGRRRRQGQGGVLISGSRF